MSAGVRSERQGGDPALHRGVRAALAHLDRHATEFVGDLAGLCRVAGVSAERPTSLDMRLSATLVAALAHQAGLEHAAVRDFREAHPYVTADWLHAPGAPTLLLYAHHDVQPAGDLAEWLSAPTEPAIREGRLYARGAADDKGGIVGLLSGVACFLRSGEPLPCNVRLLVDGEEEVGSPHLEEFLREGCDCRDVDAVVVMDTPNAAAGRPALTCSLRGNALIDVEVRCLEHAVHSGRGGGLVPDPIQVLCALIHRLGGNEGLRPAAAGPRVTYADVPFDARAYRQAMGMRPGVEFAGDPRLAPLDRLWAEPALTVTAFEGPRLAEASNRIAPTAAARLSVRTAPGEDPAAAAEAVRRALAADVPCGAELRVTIAGLTRGWHSPATGPAQRAALEALERGYRSPAVALGAGGSIGFVSAIARALPDAPGLLLGLEDPASRTHAPNESVRLADLESAIRSVIHLMDGLAGQARGSA